MSGETPVTPETPGTAGQPETPSSGGMIKSAFWLVVLTVLAVIGWEFFGAQEQPMETKILVVFCTFVVSAILFRWFHRRSVSPLMERSAAEAIEWSDTGISAVLLAFVIMAFIMQAFKIPSGSMTPTLLVGDHLFVNKFIYGTQVPFTLKKLWTLKQVQRNHVVVFLCPPSALSEEDKQNNVKKDFIKRAIGLPGDVVEIRSKTLYINGQKADDPHAYYADSAAYPKSPVMGSKAAYQGAWEKGEFAHLPGGGVPFVRDNFGPVTVPAKHFFVMGDNRDASFDSRFWGPLPEEYFKGRAWLVYWPFNRFGKIN